VKVEKVKQTALPKEVECLRPDLYCMGVEIRSFGQSIDRRISNGIQLRKGGDCSVVVRENSNDPFPEIPGKLIPVPVGTVLRGPATWPKYTDPIDDETIANILIYGG
jgi:hypothetical protein